MYRHIDYPESCDTYYFSPRDAKQNKIVNEPIEVEEAKVRKALEIMKADGFLPTDEYDTDAFMRLRSAVRQNYEILWTSITPPMERLLYAISAIKKPKNIVCLGIFCGNTLTWNVGAASGPGKVFDANNMVGVEIVEEPANLAKRNLESIGMNDVNVLCQDGFKTIEAIDYEIDLLYLDAFGYDPDTDIANTKLIYLSMLKRALPKLAPGAVVLAHDVLIAEFSGPAKRYLDYVRDDGPFKASYCVEIDEEGLEVTFA